MRIIDCRYDRDRLRLAVAFRLIGHEARTHTIRHCTGLSGDRIRKLYRNYPGDATGTRIRRRRGKSPRQMSYFRRTPEHELQAATFVTLLSCCGMLRRVHRLPAPRIEDVARFCDVYEAFLCVCPSSLISFEHAWYLGQTLALRDEYVLARCPDCRGTWIRDTLDLQPCNCANCRHAASPGPTKPDASPADC